MHKKLFTPQTVPLANGTTNFCVFSANCDPKNRRGLGILVSSDQGETWRVAPPAKHLSAGMPPTGLLPLKDGTVALFGQIRNDSKVKTDGPKDDQNVWMALTRDGGLTWSAPRIIAHKENKNLCEPFAIRSPDGQEIALIMRENRHTARSMVVFSRDEGRTWTAPKDTSWGLTGDRHEGFFCLTGASLLPFAIGR